MLNVYIKTFGCALNQSDSEMMAGILEKEGYTIISDEKKADVVIINSCTVKNEAENKLYKEIRRHKDKKVIVAGCVAQAEKKLKDTKLKDYSIIGVSQISKIGFIVKQTLSGKRIILLDNEKKCINLPKIRKNKHVGIIPISEGCLGACTYCKTKHARGELMSYKKKEIIYEIKKALKDDAKEIWITSQDTGAYGLDINEDLPSLLYDVLKIEGNFMVRLGMLNPNFGVRYLDDLKKLLMHKKMFRFIHLPVQSGSDKILKDMGRKYTGKEFLRLVKTLKKDVFDLTFATDVIIGFPGETKEDFESTLTLVKKLKPDILNMSRFWKRPKTPAANMKQIDSKIIKERSIILRELFHKIAFEKNKKWIGWKGSAVIDGKGKDDTLTARNYAYKLIIIKDEGQKIGDKINIKVNSATKWDLRAEVVKN